MLRLEIVFPRASAIGYQRFYGIRQSAETVRRELTDVERGAAIRGQRRGIKPRSKLSCWRRYPL